MIWAVFKQSRKIPLVKHSLKIFERKGQIVGEISLRKLSLMLPGPTAESSLRFLIRSATSRELVGTMKKVLRLGLGMNSSKVGIIFDFVFSAIEP